MSPAELAKNFQSLEASIAEQRGDFRLFALFLREDVPDRWDLVVAAPWSTDRNELLNYLVEQIRTKMGAKNLNLLSRIVIVDPEQPAVQNLNRAINVRHGQIEVKDSNFFGLPIRHAYIITSHAPDPAHANTG